MGIMTTPPRDSDDEMTFEEKRHDQLTAAPDE